ncbi:MAG: hypothetical protein CMM02_00330 [Rhodopirellula sp.]|nr:hypothetical protein [Rhodopirellula sp.]
MRVWKLGLENRAVAQAVVHVAQELLQPDAVSERRQRSQLAPRALAPVLLDVAQRRAATVGTVKSGFARRVRLFAAATVGARRDSGFVGLALVREEYKIATCRFADGAWKAVFACAQDKPKLQARH